ncbi:MAG: hypothetical protein WA896_06980 [Spirulinaceae cyanobacterium]
MPNKTSLQLTFKDKLIISAYALLLAIFAILPPFFIFYELGVTTLSCQRIESSQVSCNNRKLRFFSLIKLPSTSLERVSEAKFKSLTSHTPNGNKVVRNFVTLVTSEGEVNIFKGNAAKMQEFVAQINSFLDSNEASLIIKHEINWFWSWKLLPLGIYLIFWEGAIIWSIFILFSELTSRPNETKSY